MCIFFFDCIFYAMYEWLCALLTIFSSCVRGFRFFFFSFLDCVEVSAAKKNIDQQPVLKMLWRAETLDWCCVQFSFFFFWFERLSPDRDFIRCSKGMLSGKNEKLLK